MSVFSLFKEQVEQADEKKKIIFPESNDLRILTAVSNLNKDNIIDPILIGKREDIEKLAAENNLDLDGVKIYDQNNYAGLDEMAEAFVKARKKDTSIAEAKAKLAKGNYFGTMLVKMGKADGMVSGAAHSTANTVLPALQLIHAAKGMHRVSGAFVMEKGDERYIFADCAINIDPDEETLAESLQMVNYNLMLHLFHQLVKKKHQALRWQDMLMYLYSQNFNLEISLIRWCNDLVTLLQ